MELKIKAFIGKDSSKHKCLALYTELGHSVPLNSGMVLSNLWRYLLCIRPDATKPGHSIKVD